MKAQLSDQQKLAIADGIAKMLLIQMTLAPVPSFEVTKIEVKKGQVNKKALGYLYGFVDGAVQSGGATISDVNVGVPILWHVLRALFPGHECEYMEFLSNHENDKALILGRMESGQQFLDYRPKEGSKRGAPMGFARFITEGANGQ